MKRTLLVGAALLVLAGGCAQRPQPLRMPEVSAQDSALCAQENIAWRAEVDAEFRNDPDSPFRRDTSITFTGIRWFPIDARFRQRAVLQRYDAPETVVVMGTKGEPRKQLRYGFFELVLPDEKGAPVAVRLNVYKFTPSDSLRYARYRDHLSMWFTDLTTGKETYHVGRYIELGAEHADSNDTYTIDLNKAFNPYCAYSAQYSCAIPTDEDKLPIAVRAGEMTYHE
jgi:uncharacterized protein